MIVSIIRTLRVIVRRYCWRRDLGLELLKARLLGELDGSQHVGWLLRQELTCQRRLLILGCQLGPLSPTELSMLPFLLVPLDRRRPPNDGQLATNRILIIQGRLTA